jgi:hypothetical protein
MILAATFSFSTVSLSSTRNNSIAACAPSGACLWTRKTRHVFLRRVAKRFIDDFNQLRTLTADRSQPRGIVLQPRQGLSVLGLLLGHFIERIVLEHIRPRGTLRVFASRSRQAADML